MPQERVIIDHKTIKSDFLVHLQIEGNKRILFSGPFGAGKSTFLQEVVNQYSEEYIFLNLYPVNYSVSVNEDVFELIKYDLLCELIGKYLVDIDLQKEDFTVLLSSQVFLLQRMKYLPIVNAIISLSEKIGKPAVGMIKALSETVKDFKAFKKEIELDEDAEIKKYLSDVETMKGTPYEMDAISYLIADLIGRVKAKQEVKPRKSILIIDDLDRLDPEHTFRLFNIFSAHYDQVTDNNKFGFDKVVFVSDVENIRALFHHRYGEGVSFNGYIDKFYSKAIFEFDNRRFIRDNLFQILSQIPFDKRNLAERYDLANEHGAFFSALEWIVVSLIDSRKLSLRALVQFPPISLPTYTFAAGKHNRSHVAAPYEILVLFRILKCFFTDYKMLAMEIESLTHFYSGDQHHIYSQLPNKEESDIRDIVLSYCLVVLIPDGAGFDRMRSGMNGKDYLLHLSEFDAYVHYNYESSRESRIFVSKITVGEQSNSGIKEINLYKILYHTLLLCNKNGYLK